MDIAKLTGIVLFAPFAAVLAVLAVKYIKTGYKKGALRTLLSLGATAAAIALSIFVVRYCEAFLTTKALSALSASGFDRMGILAKLFQAGFQSVLKTAFTFGLFALSFWICLFLLKGIVKLLTLGSLSGEEPGAKGSRILGMGIGGLDALIAAFMLLLPLYGILNLAIFPVTQIASKLPNASPQVEVVLQTTQQHPVMKLYRSDGAELVYEALLVYSMDGEAVAPDEMAATLEGVISRIGEFRSTNGTNKGVLAEELIGFLQSSVAEGDLNDEIVGELCGELKNSTEGELTEMFENVTLPEGTAGIRTFLKDVLGGKIVP